MTVIATGTETAIETAIATATGNVTGIEIGIATGTGTEIGQGRHPGVVTATCRIAHRGVALAVLTGIGLEIGPGVVNLGGAVSVQEAASAPQFAGCHPGALLRGEVLRATPPRGAMIEQ